MWWDVNKSDGLGGRKGGMFVPYICRCILKIIILEEMYFALGKDWQDLTSGLFMKLNSDWYFIQLRIDFSFYNIKNSKVWIVSTYLNNVELLKTYVVIIYAQKWGSLEKKHEKPGKTE